jgi:TolB-like protein
VDTRSDIFSFGVVLYEMLAGVNPFSKGGHMETAKAVLGDTAPPLTRYAEDIPLLLQHTVKKMLAKEPDQRYQLVHDVKTDLDELSVTSGESEVSEDTPAATPPKRSYLWPAVVGGVVVVVLLLLALLLPFTATPSEEAITSIAVLPFENRSGDPELEYVSDGIAEGIIHRLSQLSSLDKVISSTSLRRYKGKAVDPQTVTQEVDARAVVVGNMVQLGENIRISVELVDGENNATLWGDSYTRPRSSLYELEEYLSKEIADALGIQLTAEEGERLSKRYTQNGEAHEAYLKGAAENTRRGSPNRAILYFEEAIEKDPNYAAAYAGMARTYTLLAVSRTLPTEEAYSKIEEFAKKALEIDDTLSRPHGQLSFVNTSYHWDWKEAEREAKLALELGPADANSHAIYARYLGMMGRFDEAILFSRRAQQLNPLAFNLQVIEAIILYQARRYDESIEAIQRAQEMFPTANMAGFLQRLRLVYEATQLYEKAVAAYQETLKREGASQEEITGLADAFQSSGVEGYWRWRLNHLAKRASREYVPRGAFAEIHAALGEKDLAFEELEKAYQEREADLTSLKVEPRWDPLRNDPRFQALLLRMNLEP